VVLLFVFVRDFATPRGGAPGPMGGGMGGMGTAQGRPAMAAGEAGDEAAAEQPPAGPPDVRGTITLGKGVKVEPGATLFVIARPAGTQRGPPVAAARIVASRFPVAFSLGAENSMTGQPFPDKALVQVRVDFDGNPMTHDPAEPAASADGVPRGADGLTLELKAPAAP
jgi:hypothetical protein